MEKRRAVGVIDNFTIEFDRDASGIGLMFGPPAVIGRNFADGAHQTRVPVDDGDEMADRPLVLVRPERTADHTLRSVQSHQAPDHARWLDVPPVEPERLPDAIRFGLASRPDRGWRTRSSPLIRLAYPFESIAKKLAVGAKRMHV